MIATKMFTFIVIGQAHGMTTTDLSKTACNKLCHHVSLGFNSQRMSNGERGNFRLRVSATHLQRPDPLRSGPWQGYGSLCVHWLSFLRAAAALLRGLFWGSSGLLRLLT